ncbi:MAG TPA: type IX secretion system outer membrane channel protein PorV [Bacteroidia bacterium]|nr:type IX secretion system outer membrane channel protein PorV [Bacteroidia bacterium]
MKPLVYTANIAVLLLLSGVPAVAQNTISPSQMLGQLNTITPAVPFLLITPDTRAAGMGDGGVAVSPDANAANWNLSHLAFAEKKFGISVSYTPWLRALVPDINLAYGSFYFKPDSISAISASVRYFSLGSVTMTSSIGTIGQYRPFELAVDIGYARKLGKRFSAGIGFRYIHSDPYDSNMPGASRYMRGRAYAGDLSATYRTEEFNLGSWRCRSTTGLTVSNMGSKIWYYHPDTADFLPANLRLGSGVHVEADEYNSFLIHLEFNKLLVPTQPIYELDPATGSPKVVNGQYVILDGKDPNRPVMKGMFGSFTDAPGGFREELREISIGAGVEYWYNKIFAVRAGYFYENKLKGNRQFFTLGAGIRYNVFGLDFAYLIPANDQRSPLGNTLRFTLMCNFDGAKVSPRPRG